MARSILAIRIGVAAALVALAGEARAIPAFARKYGTSCLTCHTVYPKLTPFGEAFRRNGYLFPGVDSDYVKQETIALGQEANKKTFPSSVWPATIPTSVPIAIGANGQAFLFPDGNASKARANGGAGVSLDDLIAEAHLWAGASLDDSTTLWAEGTLSRDGTVSVEHAQLLLNSLLGPKHALNLVVGRGFPTLTSFGPHSSYLGDAFITNVPVTGIYGVSGDPFVLVDNYNAVELTSILGGRVGASLGVNTGKNSVGGRFFNSESVYGHVGVKLGGMRLDGEGAQGPADSMRPWAEDALTVDVFGFRSRDYFALPATGGGMGPAVADTALTVGADLRAQLGSLELNAGAYLQHHDRGTAALDVVNANVQWGELSYVLFPWMVPAVRVERIGLRPAGGPNVSDVHLMPGVAFLLRANVKAVLVANFEFADGFPVDAGGAPLGWDGGNADWGGFAAAPGTNATTSSTANEFQSIALYFAFAM